ncbi:Cytochrome P450 [Plasmodiophora brassicae]|uniref:Mitochondrial hydroperoxide bicyclase CYP50918A1 n=1 Tax=Plasmodiophora brassicae TaxID=37360 RepID=CP8A1_PLABS|nr:RecName: Full=Mitochondrial hydroperoxide bicyclase CYP50918A1; AltName: Full=Cytochrome P450 50918A1 [Plasmodiophora brassicae]CEO97746.1 hypothetical protein PBRA_005860 [Plasmodiophora brassicae]SPQ98293.1 unnamed protein product [Plasmodiophora brassicae]
MPDAFDVSDDKQLVDQQLTRDSDSKPAAKPASKQKPPSKVPGVLAADPVPEPGAAPVQAREQGHAPQGNRKPAVLEPAYHESRVVRLARYVASWTGPVNPLPAIDVLRWATNLMQSFIDARAAAGGVPVFRMHIGLPVVVITDHASAKFFLGSPSSDLDREDFKRFGPLGVAPSLLKNAMPSLVASDATGHKVDRALTVAVMHSRFKHVDEALRQSQQIVYDDFMPGVFRHPDQYTIRDVAYKFVGQFMFKWLLNTTPPSLKALRGYPVDCIIDLQTSNWLGTLVGSALCKLKMAATHSSTLNAEGLDIVRHSRLYETYRKMAETMGYTTADLDLWLQFLVQFNGVAGIGLTLASAIAVLSEQLSTLDELRREVGDEPLRFDTVDGKFPLLDSFAYEWMRFFMGPRVIFKKAMKDLQVPTSDGNLYKVRKDELICAALPLCQRDGTVYDAPNRFNARRFLDNPSLKWQVFNFGFVEAEHNPKPVQTARFGCALYSAGVGLALFKVLIGTWIQRIDWECDQEFTFVGNDTGDHGPPNGKFSVIKPRQPKH